MIPLQLLAFHISAPLGNKRLLIDLTCEAKRREQSDSCALSASGASATSIIAFPVADRHGCRMCVSLELRYGTCAFLLLRAAKMSARLLSDLLMAWVSFSRSPSACDLRHRSLAQALDTFSSASGPHIILP
jgi:hypothetical protein